MPFYSYSHINNNIPVSEEAIRAHDHFKRNWKNWARLGLSGSREGITQEINSLEKDVIPHATPELFEALNEKSDENFRKEKMGNFKGMIDNLFAVARGERKDAGYVQMVIAHFLYRLRKGELHEFVGLPKPNIEKEEKKNALEPEGLLDELKNKSHEMIRLLEEGEKFFEDEPGTKTQGVTAEEAKQALEKLDVETFSELCEKANSWRKEEGPKKQIGHLVDISLQQGLDPSVNPTALPILVKAIKSGELKNWIDEPTYSTWYNRIYRR